MKRKNIALPVSLLFASLIFWADRPLKSQSVQVEPAFTETFPASVNDSLIKYKHAICNYQQQLVGIKKNLQFKKAGGGLSKQLDLLHAFLQRDSGTRLKAIQNNIPDNPAVDFYASYVQEVELYSILYEKTGAVKKALQHANKEAVLSALAAFCDAFAVLK